MAAMMAMQQNLGHVTTPRPLKCVLLNSLTIKTETLNSIPRLDHVSLRNEQLWNIQDGRRHMTRWPPVK